MRVRDVLYRRIDGNECIIKGFFLLHSDGTQSLIYESHSHLKHLLYEIDKYKQLYVLFHDDTFDTVENLYTNLYMLPYEYKNWKQVYQEILDEQESYEGQHAEEPYWREEDLVPNPK